jgi:hypothetical protein
VSTPTVLPAAMLSRLAPKPAPGPNRLRRAALRRVALYSLLVPVPLAVAALAGAPLARLPWELAAALWCGASVAAAERTASPLAGWPRRYGWPLVAGAGLAATVVLVGRGFAVAPHGVPPALMPLLFAVPVLELGMWWHLARVAAGLVQYDDRDRHLRYLRWLGWTTLAGLLPPLATGVALAATASRLPYGLAGHPDAPALVLAMACGVLRVGVVAIARLLSARHRPGLAATVAWCPIPAALGLSWGQPLAVIAVALAVSYATGLVLAAYALFDPRSPQ